jgi:hypothetical protein
VLIISTIDTFILTYSLQPNRIVGKRRNPSTAKLKTLQAWFDIHEIATAFRNNISDTIGEGHQSYIRVSALDYLSLISVNFKGIWLKTLS